MFVTLFSLLLISPSPTSAQDMDDKALPQALAALAPHLAILFVVLLKIHLLLYPKLALRSLMDQYRNDGASIQGQVLSCETKPGTSEKTFIAEIVYERTQHKNANDPSLRFRHPTEVVSKMFVRRFELGRKVTRGEEVEMLVLPGNPRSACPKEVVEGILAEHDQERTKKTIVWGTLLCGGILGLAVEKVVRLNDPMTGWAVLLVGVCVVEAVPFLYCADEFLKSKRRRFNSARPVQVAKSGKKK